MGLGRFFACASRRDKQYCKLRGFCKTALGFAPRNYEVYHIALTHKSSMTENPKGKRVNNERLEYLGDAMLSAVVAEYLYLNYPDKGEGFLTEARSKMVSRNNLNKIAHKMGIFDFMEYDRHSIRIDENRTIEGNALEALIGAIYIDRGYKFTHKVIVEKILHHYSDIDTLAETNWNYKGKLIDYCQKRHIKVEFVLDRKERYRRDQKIVYHVYVAIDGKRMAQASGLSIKSAEQLAAEKTYKHITSEKS